MDITYNYRHMTSDIDQKKLASAKDWISKLADGVNPIDGSALPDSDIVNNVHISRCLYFVANLLEEMGKAQKPSSKSQYEQEFHLDPETAAKVSIIDKTGIAMFVREINKVIPKNMKPLSAKKATQWLVSVGYLEELESNDGHKYKAPTVLGTSIGISAAWKEGNQGKYLAISYDANAQVFLLENLFK